MIVPGVYPSCLNPISSSSILHPLILWDKVITTLFMILVLINFLRSSIVLAVILGRPSSTVHLIAVSHARLVVRSTQTLRILVVSSSYRALHAVSNVH